MKRSLFDLSNIHSLSLDMGYLVPVAAYDVLPGDTFRLSSRILARVSPLAKPVMHPVDLRLHSFFVPNRIIWDEWEDFIVGNEGMATYPVVTPGDAASTVLLDHMGAEPVVGVDYDALPIRAYNLIFNEFYRDQDLAAVRTEDQLDMARVAWPKDYFTTARANPQQGAAVQLNFSGGPGIVQLDSGTTGTAAQWRRASDHTLFSGGAASSDAGGEINIGGVDAVYDPNGTLSMDFTGVGVDINELRNAISLQRIAEAREFYGSRYVDFLRWYGVNPKDGRLDRPEYLGGGRQQLSFSEVLATAEGTNTAVGDLFGHGIAGLRARSWRKMFEEHGWVITLMSVRPKGIYQNGIPKRFLRREPTDFWHRELELLPWQEVSQLEVFGGGSASTVFGYTPRYDEYREMASYVSGTLRGGTEEDWTLAREFAVAPTLNESFITCAPSDRIYLDNSQPELIATIHTKLLAKRLVAANARMSNRAGI